MKKRVYLSACVLLGVLLSFLVHGIAEVLMIKFLIQKGPWLSWETWFLVHHIGALVLFAAGVVFGYWFGKKWWHIVYIEKRHF